ncbi:MAG: pheT, partial [Clostridia bacterium]|nr:pheT [Clostridia bacterium]
GMFCSVSELNMTTHDYPGSIEDGILILKEGNIGEDICKTLGLDDIIYEVDVVTNRPDCLSVIGIAREASVTFKTPLKINKPVVKALYDNTNDISKYLKVSITAKDLCKRYSARIVTDVKIEPSPFWLVEHLRSSGVRSINNIVDITNYVMLEYGQPMHAFDYSCVDGASIEVRNARDGEKMNTLDGQVRSLSSDMLVIADAVKPVAVAGIMGGENSEIKDNTKTIIFESANFFGPSIRKTSKKLGLRTESSARFEKGLDANMAVEALDRACELVELLNAGKVLHDIIDIDYSEKSLKKIPLESDWINRYLNISIPIKTMDDILTSLDFMVKDGIVTVPSFRDDIENKYDLSEEIARIYGYEKIPSAFFKTDVQSGGYTYEQKFENKLNIVLRAVGLSEIATYSFISPKYYDKVRIPAESSLRDSLKILNPLGEDSSIMRTTTLPSMLETLARNNNYRNPSVFLYEIGKTFLKNKDEKLLPDERAIITIGFYDNNQTDDFFALKGMIEEIMLQMNINKCEYKPCFDNPSYHPGKTANIVINNEIIGVFGQVHPLVQENYDIDKNVYCAEIDFNKLFYNVAPEKHYKPIPKYPAVTRDLALICKKDIYSGELEKKICNFAGDKLENIYAFDVYTGKQVPDGYKSIAYALSLRTEDKTLQDTEVDTIINNILSELEKEGITLRK